MGEGAFEDLLGGFTPTTREDKMRTIKEMRKEQQAQEMDPEKLRVCSPPPAANICSISILNVKQVNPRKPDLKMHIFTLLHCILTGEGVDRREGTKHPCFAVLTAHSTLGRGG